MPGEAPTVVALEGESASDALRVDVFLAAVDHVLGTIKDGHQRPPRRLLDAMAFALRVEGEAPLSRFPTPERAPGKQSSLREDAVPGAGRQGFADALHAPRFHALVVLEAACACSGAPFADVAPLASPAALAIELAVAHCRVHDELPVMDTHGAHEAPALHAPGKQFSLRENAIPGAGRHGSADAVHAAFDEAAAILTGDALLADAFGLLASAPLRTAEQVRELSLATGSCSIELASIERRRSARLVAAAAVLGGLAVDAEDAQLHALRSYGEALGASRRIGVTGTLATEARERAVRHAKKLGRFAGPLIALARAG